MPGHVESSSRVCCDADFERTSGDPGTTDSSGPRQAGDDRLPQLAGPLGRTAPLRAAGGPRARPGGLHLLADGGGPRRAGRVAGARRGWPTRRAWGCREPYDLALSADRPVGAGQGGPGCRSGALPAPLWPSEAVHSPGGSRDGTGFRALRRAEPLRRGVPLRRAHRSPQPKVLGRADEALYKAKPSGPDATGSAVWRPASASRRSPAERARGWPVRPWTQVGRSAQQPPHCGVSSALCRQSIRNSVAP